MESGVLSFGDDGGLYYEYDAPAADGETFVFVNALTGSTGMWQAEIAPALRADGFGTLVYNLRGQADSPFRPGLALDQGLIVGDLIRLLVDLEPPRPVLVGLSIGGLYAAGAVLGGAACRGLVLINTLRRVRPGLEWVNAAMARAARLGGTRLVMDMYMPLLVNEERTAAARADFLTDAPYEGLDPAHGHANLLANGGSADWDVPWERLDVPTLVITGLQDRVFYHAGDVAELTARLPQAASVTMRDAGHLIPVERPAALTQALRAFASSLPRS